MSQLSKAYEPQKHEDSIYKNWEKSGFFNPDKLKLPKTAKDFSIMMPPPNVTGVLHLGHALENTIMDIEVRYQRMLGKRALLLPGTDHAAVATQAKVEKILISQGIKHPREELGREKLLEKIREYAEESKSTILKQIRKMGTSCDWSRLAYTFDKQRNEAVNDVFIRMFNDGLIYRGYRVVNWSVKGQSTCSDDELVYEERKTILYTFKYSKDFPIAISTTRPETKLGDTAVAVNPNDKRYKKYIGKTFTVDVGAQNPLEIKIVADKEVDPKFGTGAVGVTPAHSQVDYDMYLRHKLRLIEVIGPDGKMAANAGKNYQGLTVEQAREKFVSYLKKNDLISKEEEITHNVGTSDRFGDIVEVLPMQQWFVDVNRKIPKRNKSLKDLMREAVTKGHRGKKDQKIHIVPSRFNDTYLRWIDGLRDWCISRQIWWGHRIPIWYCHDCNEMIASKTTLKKCLKCKSVKLVQDEDTLDTWFSSGTWTFSTLGWPKKTSDLKRFHPTSWMQMGYEILFFWMARMILMSTYALDEIPFKDVYIHGILRDKQGRKFSKSLGNGIDPIEVIKMYGTDALRLSLILGIAPGNDSRFYEEKVEGARNFVNKLWNISRYILDKAETKKRLPDLDEKSMSVSDKWIIGKLHALAKDVTDDLDNYRFSAAAERLKDFTWNDFADWYIEISKVEQDKEPILMYCLNILLRLWHPYIPFVTEELYQGAFARKKNDYLLVQQWPKMKVSSKAAQKTFSQFELLKSLISQVRHLRAVYHIEPAKIIPVVFTTDNTANLSLLKKNQAIISRLARVEIKAIEKKAAKPKKSAMTVVSDIKGYILLENIVDIEKEKERLQKELQSAESYFASLQKKLSNKAFVKNAPKEIVAKEKERLALQKSKINELKNYLKGLA